MTTMPLNISVPDITRIGLNEGLKDAVAKLYTVLSSSSLDAASQERFEKGLQKVVDAYDVALRIARKEV